jgi:Spy/CpxP family protein refolding chaperone
LRELLLSAREQLCELHFDARGVREEIGEAVRAEKFDEARFLDAETKMSDKFRQASGVVRNTLSQMHEVLDSRQRAKVARWLASGPHGCHRFSHC